MIIQVQLLVLVLLYTQRHHYLVPEQAFLVQRNLSTILPKLVALMADKVNNLRNMMAFPTKVLVLSCRRVFALTPQLPLKGNRAEVKIAAVFHQNVNSMAKDCCDKWQEAKGKENPRRGSG